MGAASRHDSAQGQAAEYGQISKPAALRAARVSGHTPSDDRLILRETSLTPMPGVSRLSLPEPWHHANLHHISPSVDAEAKELQR